MPGVKQGVKVKDTAVAVVADTWWQAKTALDALPIVWDEGANAKVSSATIAEHLKEGLTATETNGDAARTATRSRRSRARRRRSRRSTHAVPAPRLHGADERHGEAFGRQGRGLGADARTSKPRSPRCRKPPALPLAKCEVLPARSRRRLRPARRHAGLRAPGGRDRQAIPRHAGQADLEPRGGSGARLLPPDLAVQAVRRPRRRRQSGRPARAHFGPVDQCLAQPGRHRRRQGHAPASGLLRASRATRSSATPCRTC